MRTHTDDAASAIIQPRLCNDRRLGYLDIRLKWSLWVKACMYAFPSIFLSERFISRSSFDDCRFSEHIPSIALIPKRFCFLMSSERIDKFLSYIPYVTAFVLVALYFIFVLPHIQDYLVAASGYVTAVQTAAHAQEFPRGCSPVIRYNRPVFEIYGLY